MQDYYQKFFKQYVLMLKNLLGKTKFLILWILHNSYKFICCLQIFFNPVTLEMNTLTKKLYHYLKVSTLQSIFIKLVQL